MVGITSHSPLWPVSVPVDRGPPKSTPGKVHSGAQWDLVIRTRGTQIICTMSSPTPLAAGAAAGLCRSCRLCQHPRKSGLP